MMEGKSQDGGSGQDGGNGQEGGSGMVRWRSPSNIALIKYWGKRSGQIPENPSISITISRSHTETQLRFSPAAGKEGNLTGFLFEGMEQSSFAGRIGSYLAAVRSLYPFLKDFDISLESSNSFPHSSGIASSASAMSALALCLTSMERKLFNSPSDDESFFRKASYAARIGSGSAARSVYPGYVLWGAIPEIPHSENEFAMPLNKGIHDDMKNMGDAILIVDDSPKPVSSSKGHELMETNPWSPVRYDQAQRHAARLIQVLASGDMEEFVTIVEREALTLHALMMSSESGYILLRPGTLNIIERVRRFRQETGIPVAFTLDAGPNVHLIYPAGFGDRIKIFLKEQLLQFCRHGKWIDDAAGNGPLELTGGETI